MVDLLKYLTNLKPVKAYTDSLNTYIKNPLLFIPFALETILPIIITSIVILLIMGSPGIDYYYGETLLLADPLAGPKMFFSLMISAIAGAFILSFFDASGISMILTAVKDKKASLSNAWNQGSKLFIKQISIFLLMALTGIGLIFPLLFFVTFGTTPFIYVLYSFAAAIFYLTCLLYPRIISVVEEGSPFKAYLDGIKFVFTNLPHVISCVLIIVVVFAAFSLISVFSPQAYFFSFMLFLFPWFNIFLTNSYLIKRSVTKPGRVKKQVRQVAKKKS